MNCEQVEELAGAYALGALPPGEKADVERHLASCDRHPEMRELQAVAASLASAAPPLRPSAALRSRLMAAVRAESTAVPLAEPAMQEPPGILARLFSPRVAPYSLAAGLAVIVMALVGWNLYLQMSDNGNAAVVRTISAGVTTGRIVYLPDEHIAIMTMDGLADPPADRAYQAWSLTGGQARSLGVLPAPRDGHIDAVLSGDLAGADRIAVTVEPAGGSDQPTSAPLFAADL